MIIIPKISQEIVVDGETLTVVDISIYERAVYARDDQDRVFPVRFSEISRIVG